MTKKELEEKCKALRAELDKAHEELEKAKKESPKVGELNKRAVGGYFNKDRNKWILVELSFDKESGAAKVDKEREIGVDYAMFDYYVRKFVAEEINLKEIRQ